MYPFEQSLRRAKVGAREVDVQEGATAAHLLNAVGENTGNKSLVQISPQGSAKTLRSSDRIDFRDGDAFDVQLNGEAG